MTDLLQRRSDWFAKLTRLQIAALFEYRRTSRVAHPDAENAMDAGWDEAPAPIQQMPRDLVITLDRGL